MDCAIWFWRVFFIRLSEIKKKNYSVKTGIKNHRQKSVFKSEKKRFRFEPVGFPPSLLAVMVHELRMIFCDCGGFGTPSVLTIHDSLWLRPLFNTFQLKLKSVNDFGLSVCLSVRTITSVNILWLLRILHMLTGVTPAWFLLKMVYVAVIFFLQGR
jgi:hypothetical protein